MSLTYVKTLNTLVGTCVSRKVVVIVKPGCPHCEAATAKLLDDGVPHYVVPASSVSQTLLDSMAKALGVATFPRVFVHGVFMGGNSELQKIAAEDLLKAAPKPSSKQATKPVTKAAAKPLTKPLTRPLTKPLTKTLTRPLTASRRAIRASR